MPWPGMRHPIVTIVIKLAHRGIDNGNVTVILASTWRTATFCGFLLQSLLRKQNLRTNCTHIYALCLQNNLLKIV